MQRRQTTESHGDGAVGARQTAHYAAIIAAPFGILGLRVGPRALAGIDFLPDDTPLQAASCEVADVAVRRLTVYFSNPETRFDLPMQLQGSDFRRRVWHALQRIPVGTTVSYADLAAVVGSSPRAVGQAVGDNPLPIVIPCHRVVGRRDLGGFAHTRGGPALAIKRWLLAHEGALGR